MISMRKQLFGLLLCVGIATVILTASSVNITIHDQFNEYVEQNIQKTSTQIVKRLENLYRERGGWVGIGEDELLTQTQIGNFAFSILDKEKEKVWGVSKDELQKQLQTSPHVMAMPWPLSKVANEMVYIFEDMPIKCDKNIVGYARVGYFPSFLLSTDDIAFQRDINKSIISSGLIGLICFACIAGYITNLFTRPIYAIARTSAELSNGRYTARYSRESRIKEIENLRLSMNYLAQKLEQQDVLRKKLISDVSHEIRTPLHILQSNLEAMIDGIYPIDQEQMEVLYAEVVRFSSLLSGLDKLKNIEDDHTVLHMGEIELNKELKEIYQTFKILASERKINYKAHTKPSEGVVILADAHALKQIFMNVCSNAFKFTEKGTIKIETKVQGKWVNIVVSDTGIGIAEEDIPYVFERMYRGDKSREQYEGSGIGLTIVKKLVTVHGGKIDIQSKEGKGTVVTIKLPIEHWQKPNPSKTLSIKI
ncbi:MAG: sensor histidine kinase [Cellulosilyticaceae bacterium]